ncbi:MAG: CRISPR-associated endonuclease Cas2 [Patescibacteria group bacterium]
MGSKNIFNFNKPKTPTEWLIFIAATGVALSSPSGTRTFLKELNKYLNNKFSDNYQIKPGQLSKALHDLKKRKIIEIKDTGNNTRILLTEKGKKKKLEYDLDKIKISNSEKWDGKWRFLMFDIPESKKNAREAFREKLKQLGFFQFQKSVWVYPYQCQDEIDFISEVFEIAVYITILTVRIDDDKPLRSYFGL